MKRNIIISIITLIVLTFVLVQCTKENTNKITADKVEFRNGSDCNPQDLYDFTGCTITTESKTISFTNRPQLYSQLSFLFQLCPDLQIDVQFKKTVCYDDNGKRVTMISSLSYDLSAIFNDCPNLATAVRREYYLKGSVIDILDLIDDEISTQLEYEIAWEDIAEDHIECPNETYHIKYIKNTCYKWELVGVVSTWEEYVWAKVACDGSVCCARSHSYCGLYDNATGLYGVVIFKPSNYQTFEGECDEGCTHDCNVTNDAESEGDVLAPVGY